VPYGVFSTQSTAASPRCGVAIGDTILDLAAIAHLLRCVEGLDTTCFSKAVLNDFMAHPAPVWETTRRRITALLQDGPEGCSALRDDAALRERALVARNTATMHMPAQIGDYTDFYASREHAYNCGCMFRSPDKALQPNWLHLPVGYHGRSSTVCLSGTPVVRPCGQLQKDPNDPTQGSVFSETKMLDFECEMGFFVGGPSNSMGTRLSVAEARSRIFGLVLLNDWSARDIQAWEYVPLGPFLSKNFATSISAWVVPFAALEPFACPTSAGSQDPPPLEYLRDPGYCSYDVALSIGIRAEGMPEAAPVSETNMRNLYWSIQQQLAHHAATGCVMRAGDLLGTGTISGSTSASLGSMLELSWRGSREVSLCEYAHIRERARVRATVRD